MDKFNIVEFLKRVDAPDIFNFIKFPATRDSHSVLFFGFQNNEGVLSMYSKLDSNQVCDSATIYLTIPLEELCASKEKLSWVSGNCSDGGLSKFFCVVREYEKDVDISETLYHKVESPIDPYFKIIEDYFEKEIVRETFNVKFKDGDFVHIKDDVGHCYIAIFKRYEGFDLCYYVLLDNNVVIENHWFNVNGCSIRPATFLEKQQLFGALAKKGKRWNPETKQLEDLPKKREFEPMDYVLVKSKKDNYAIWNLYQFAYKGINMFYMVGNISFIIADNNFLPYNDQTKHLLGTPDNWKGDAE